MFAIAGSPGRLSPVEQTFLADYSGRFVVSAVSIREIRLKWQALHSSGDRKGPLDPSQALQILFGRAVDFVDLTPAHAVTPLARPITHRDPFAKLLLVQAQSENLRLLTRDRSLAAHPLAVRL